MGNSIYLGGGIKSAFCGGNVKEIWQGSNKIFSSDTTPHIWDGSLDYSWWKPNDDVNYIYTPEQFAGLNRCLCGYSNPIEFNGWDKTYKIKKDLYFNDITNFDNWKNLGEDWSATKKIQCWKREGTTDSYTLDFGFNTLYGLACADGMLFMSHPIIKNLILKKSMVVRNDAPVFFSYERSFYGKAKIVNLLIDSCNVVSTNNGTYGIRGIAIRDDGNKVGVAKNIIVKNSYYQGNKTAPSSFLGGVIFSCYSSNKFTGKLTNCLSYYNKTNGYSSLYETCNQYMPDGTWERLFRGNNTNISTGYRGTSTNISNAILEINSSINSLKDGETSLLDENGDFTGICP